MVNIKNLSINIGDKKIISEFNLEINPGETHVLMGPNGSGKSTLVQAIAGHPDYVIESGQVLLNEVDLLHLEPFERAHAGLFLAFQYPIEIPGVSLLSFLKTSYNAHRSSRNEDPVDAADFINLAKKHIKTVGLDESFLYRSLNDGFSGGEKKRCELLQILLLKPSFVIFDETDSGLDIDAIKIVGEVIQQLKDIKTTCLVITHYERLLDYIKADLIHVFAKGKIIHTGDKQIVKKLEEAGYQYFTKNKSDEVTSSS